MNQRGALAGLSAELQNFADERDWQQFHTPKNLAMALAVEASEILELFQWMTAKESQELSDSKCLELADELADTFVYLIRLADMTGIDLLQATRDKIARNHEKYPADLVKGSAKKYSEY